MKGLARPASGCTGAATSLTTCWTQAIELKSCDSPQDRSVVSAPYRCSTRPALVEEGTLRMAPILVLPELLAEMGHDPGPLIAETGLAPAIFENRENTISFADLGRLFALCATRTGCPSLGLRIGEMAGSDVLGVIGDLANHCPDLGSAIRNIILYMHLHDRGSVPALWVCGNRAMIPYVIHQPDVSGTEQICDGALAIMYNVLKSLAGPGWEPSEVCLSRSRPAQIEPYQRFFRTRLSFGGEYNAVVFAASWLASPLKGSDALIHRQVMQEIEALEARGAGDLSAQLRRVLRQLLVGGAGQGKLSLEQVAKLFAIHRRTLNRRLRAQGTSFQTLVEETRYDIARQLLRDTRLSVLEVAVTLGYADASAFTRAFRRWSATSPAVWRSAHNPS